MTVFYVLLISFVAASMVTAIRRFEPNRTLAFFLSILVFLTAALAILDKFQ